MVRNVGVSTEDRQGKTPLGRTAEQDRRLPLKLQFQAAEKPRVATKEAQAGGDQVVLAAGNVAQGIGN